MSIELASIDYVPEQSPEQKQLAGQAVMQGVEQGMESVKEISDVFPLTNDEIVSWYKLYEGLGVLNSKEEILLGYELVSLAGGEEALYSLAKSLFNTSNLELLSLILQEDADIAYHINLVEGLYLQITSDQSMIEYTNIDKISHSSHRSFDKTMNISVEDGKVVGSFEDGNYKYGGYGNFERHLLNQIILDLDLGDLIDNPPTQSDGGDFSEFYRKEKERKEGYDKRVKEVTEKIYSRELVLSDYLGGLLKNYVGKGGDINGVVSFARKLATEFSSGGSYSYGGKSAIDGGLNGSSDRSVTEAGLFDHNEDFKVCRNISDLIALSLRKAGYEAYSASVTTGTPHVVPVMEYEGKIYVMDYLNKSDGGDFGTGLDSYIYNSWNDFFSDYEDTYHSVDSTVGYTITNPETGKVKAIVQTEQQKHLQSNLEAIDVKEFLIQGEMYESKSKRTLSYQVYDDGKDGNIKVKFRGKKGREYSVSIKDAEKFNQKMRSITLASKGNDNSLDIHNDGITSFYSLMYENIVFDGTEKYENGGIRHFFGGEAGIRAQHTLIKGETTSLIARGYAKNQLTGLSTDLGGGGGNIAISSGCSLDFTKISSGSTLKANVFYHNVATPNRAPVDVRTPLNSWVINHSVGIESSAQKRIGNLFLQGKLKGEYSKLMGESVDTQIGILSKDTLGNGVVSIGGNVRYELENSRIDNIQKNMLAIQGNASIKKNLKDGTIMLTGTLGTYQDFEQQYNYVAGSLEVKYSTSNAELYAKYVQTGKLKGFSVGSKRVEIGAKYNF